MLDIEIPQTPSSRPRRSRAEGSIKIKAGFAGLKWRFTRNERRFLYWTSRARLGKLGALKNADIREATLKCLSFPAFEGIMNKMMDSCDEKFGEGIPEFDAKCKKLQKIVDACADSESGDSEKGKEK